MLIILNCENLSYVFNFRIVYLKIALKNQGHYTYSVNEGKKNEFIVELPLKVREFISYSGNEEKKI